MRKGGWHKATQCPDREQAVDNLLERAGLFGAIVETKEGADGGGGGGIKKRPSFAMKRSGADLSHYQEAMCDDVDNYLFRRYNREGAKMARSDRDLALPADMVDAFRQLQAHAPAVSVHNDPDWSALNHINASVY